MNISRIQKMIIEGDFSVDGLRYLLSCHGECEHLDYKESINLNIDHDSASISKDLIGMKNIGGGYIVVGVKDKSWEPLGIQKSIGYDTKMVKDVVRKCTGLDIEVYLVEHTLFFDGENRRFCIIGVRSSSKLSKLKNPSICRVSYRESEKWGVRKGDIYIRDGDQTIRLEDLDKLLERIEDLQDKYQEAEQLEATQIPSQFEIDFGLFKLLPREYGTFVGRENLLEKIKSAVEKDPRIWIINLYGPGGVGKSALATRVAYDYFEQGTFEAIIHLSAKDKELNNGGIRILNPTLVSLEDLLDRILNLFSHQECCLENLERKRNTVIELLSAWSTLIILDNMEAVSDGRIMEFVREFPPSTKAKVLLTSRLRNSEWELPIQVPELSESEAKVFIINRSSEMHLDFPIDNEAVIKKVTEISGGLPLAIQWILGDYAISKDINSILTRVVSKQSPLLEFSFRNSWKTLDILAQQALSVLPLFHKAPTLQEWRTILDWPIEKIERAKSKLIESTFVTERTDQKTGNKVYIALPITLSFAKNEFAKFGTWGTEVISRFETYSQRMNLAQEQEYQAEDLFNRFDAKKPNQKKAILLARMAEGQKSSMGYNEAEEYYKQSLEVDPMSVYAIISYAKFKADIDDYSSALELMLRALGLLSKKTAFYIYYNLADLYGRRKDLELKVKYLEEAMRNRENVSPYLYTMAQHSLGVALGRMNNHKEAIKNFDEIIERELAKPYGPSGSLIVAARTKKISIERTVPGTSHQFLDDLINRCSKLSYNGQLIEELKNIRDNE